jgi:hypothetical protein
MWNALHWRIDKVELLQRTKEWNEGLKKYCDDMGLTGAEREAVVQKHTANPCAPCSNPSCNHWETESKEFKACSRCKSVAYALTKRKIGTRSTSPRIVLQPKIRK